MMNGVQLVYYRYVRVYMCMYMLYIVLSTWQMAVHCTWGGYGYGLRAVGFGLVGCWHPGSGLGQGLGPKWHASYALHDV
jgi:hypothetical protein